MDLASASTDYRRATEEFLAAVALIDPADLDRRSGTEWSARQVIHHVADAEAQSYARLRRLIAQPGTTIQSYDEASWAENPALGYTELPVEHSLAIIESVRAASATILDRLAPSDLDLTCVHDESGPYSLAHWLEVYTRHPREHARQLNEAAAG